jgi:excisionase family DNA binding protein
MSEILVIDKEQLPEIFRQVAVLVASEIRELPPIVHEIMTKKELADYLRCDVSKINRLMKDGLPFVKFGDAPRFYKSDIDNWLKNK